MEENNVEQLDAPRPPRKSRKKPALIEVSFSEGNTKAFKMKDLKDWGVMFDNNVLYVKDNEDTEHYYVLGNLVKWTVDELDG